VNAVFPARSGRLDADQQEDRPQQIEAEAAAISAASGARGSARRALKATARWPTNIASDSATM
jgi:hypothetical protein